MLQLKNSAMDYYFNGIRRLDWGFNNPNMTAALIAMLAVVALGTGFIYRKYFWHILPIAYVLMVCLIQTLSRGGLIALVVGFVALVVSVRPILNRSKVIALAIMTLSLIGYSYYSGGAERYTQGINGLEDRSISNRWLIYKSVPSMIVDAPQGWGIGNASSAYHQWYQPEGRDESYLNLVNSHFTWLVEWPWWARIFYITAWAVTLIMLWPYSKSRASGVALAVWATFFVAASFSSVAHRPYIWVLPFLVFSVVIIHRYIARIGLSSKQILSACLVASAVYIGIYLFASALPTHPSVWHSAGVTIIGPLNADRKIVVYGTDDNILGKRYGHRIRGYLKSHPTTNITVYDSIPKKNGVYDDIVMVGNTHEKFNCLPEGRNYLLNPSAPGDDFSTGQATSTTIIWGSFNPSLEWYSWRVELENNPKLKLSKLQGEGLYLDSWLDEIDR